MASKDTNEASKVLPEERQNGSPNQGSHPETVRVLIANDQPANVSAILRAFENQQGYQFVKARTTSEAFSSVISCQVDAIFVGQHLAEIGGAGLCRSLKNASATRFLPVFVTSPRNDIDAAVAAFEAGADGYLPAPWHPRIVRAQLQSCLRRKAAIDSLDDPESVLFSLARSLEERDGALGQHCERLALIGAAIGMQIGLQPEAMVALHRGAYLHDIGKLAIPDHILFKPGPLTEDEWEIMKSHTVRGERICANMRSLKPVLPIVRHHHEKWDGTGYPDGLKGDEIPLLARVIQTADIFDALTTVRPYKKAFTSEEAIGIMKAETAKGWRDPALTQVLCDVLPVLARTPVPDPSSSSLHALAASLASFQPADLTRTI